MPLYAVPLQRRLHALAREYRPLEQRGRHLAALERAAERLQVVTHLARHRRDKQHNGIAKTLSRARGERLGPSVSGVLDRAGTLGGVWKKALRGSGRWLWRRWRREAPRKVPRKCLGSVLQCHRHERAGERLRAEPPHALELRGVPLLRLGRGDSQGGHRRRVAALQQRERSGAERGRRHGRCGATLHQPPFLRLEILFVCQEAPHSALHVLRAAALLLDARRGAAAYRGSACCRVRVGRRRRG
mmetsp:Transcript_13424/g.45246  ORF Transcript_13424/g.45246 Transcript_13424/m.45246 type:complete len:244 (-) Transcript_13424:30-761(-)